MARIKNERKSVARDKTHRKGEEKTEAKREKRKRSAKRVKQKVGAASGLVGRARRRNGRLEPRARFRNARTEATSRLPSRSRSTPRKRRGNRTETSRPRTHFRGGEQVLARKSSGPTPHAPPIASANFPGSSAREAGRWPQAKKQPSTGTPRKAAGARANGARSRREWTFFSRLGHSRRFGNRSEQKKPFMNRVRQRLRKLGRIIGDGFEVAAQLKR